PTYFFGSEDLTFVRSVVQILPISLLLGCSHSNMVVFSRALELARGHDRQYTAILLNGLSIVCAQEGQLNEAVLHSLEALSLVREIGISAFAEIAVISNLALLMRLQGKLSEALEFELEAVSISKALAEKSG